MPIPPEALVWPGDPPVRGFLHRPEIAIHRTLILTHGAGSNCQAPLLVALADRFAEVGFSVLRCALPFRQARPLGPPRPGDAARDREGLRRAVEAMQALGPGEIYLGGHSYGGRQATMLAADSPFLVSGCRVRAWRARSLRIHHRTGKRAAPHSRARQIVCHRRLRARSRIQREKEERWALHEDFGSVSRTIFMPHSPALVHPSRLGSAVLLIVLVGRDVVPLIVDVGVTVVLAHVHLKLPRRPLAFPAIVSVSCIEIFL